jgi:hypothetical protein
MAPELVDRTKSDFPGNASLPTGSRVYPVLDESLSSAENCKPS